MKIYKNTLHRLKSGRSSALRIKASVHIRKANLDFHKFCNSSIVEGREGKENFRTVCENDRAEIIIDRTIFDENTNNNNAENNILIKSKSVSTRPLTLKDRYFAALKNKNLQPSKSFNISGKQTEKSKPNDKPKSPEIDEEVSKPEVTVIEKQLIKNVTTNNSNLPQNTPTNSDKTKAATDCSPKFDRSLLSYTKYPKKIQGIRVTKKFLLQSKGLSWKEVVQPKKSVPVKNQTENDEARAPEQESKMQSSLSDHQENMPVNNYKFKKDAFDFKEVDDAITATAEEPHSRGFLQQRILNEGGPTCIGRYPARNTALSAVPSQESRANTKVNNNNNSQADRNAIKQATQTAHNNNNGCLRKCIGRTQEKLQVIKTDFQADEPILFTANEKAVVPNKKSVFTKIKMKKISFKSKFLQSKIPVWSKKSKSFMRKEEVNQCEHARSEEDQLAAPQPQRTLSSTLQMDPHIKQPPIRDYSCRKNILEQEMFKKNSGVGRNIDRGNCDSDMVTETGCGVEESRKNRICKQETNINYSRNDSSSFNEECYAHYSGHSLTFDETKEETNSHRIEAYKPIPSPKITIKPKTRKKHLEIVQSRWQSEPDTPSPVAFPRTSPHCSPQCSPPRPSSLQLSLDTQDDAKKMCLKGVKVLRKCYPFQSEQQHDDLESGCPLRTTPEHESVCKAYPQPVIENVEPYFCQTNLESARLKQEKDIYPKVDFNKVMKSLFKKQDSEVKDNLLKALLGDKVLRKEFVEDESRRVKSAQKKRNRSESNRNFLKTLETPRKTKKQPCSRPVKSSLSLENPAKTPGNSLSNNEKPKSPKHSRQAKSFKKSSKTYNQYLEDPDFLKYMYPEKNSLRTNKYIDKKEKDFCYFPSLLNLKYGVDSPDEDTGNEKKYLLTHNAEHESLKEKNYCMERVVAYKKMFQVEKKKQNKDDTYSNKRFPTNLRNYKAPPDNEIKPFQFWLKSNNLVKQQEDSNEEESEDEPLEQLIESPSVAMENESLLSNRLYDKLFQNRSKNNNTYVRLNADKCNSNFNSNTGYKGKVYSDDGPPPGEYAVAQRCNRKPIRMSLIGESHVKLMDKPDIKYQKRESKLTFNQLKNSSVINPVKIDSSKASRISFSSTPTPDHSPHHIAPLNTNNRAPYAMKAFECFFKSFK